MYVLHNTRIALFYLENFNHTDPQLVNSNWNIFQILFETYLNTIYNKKEVYFFLRERERKFRMSIISLNFLLVVPYKTNNFQKQHTNCKYLSYNSLLKWKLTTEKWKPFYGNKIISLPNKRLIKN